MEESTSVDKSCRAGVSIASFESHSTPSEQYGRSDTDQIATFQTVEDIMSVNPYLRRADEIGFRHQVPGVGHLGSSLVPRGWKEGDPPITPAEAKKLFDIDRQSAVHDLELSLANQKHLNDEEKEKVSVSIDDQWKARLLLDRTVLTERLLIHRQHHERQQRNIERLRGDEQCFSQNRLSQVPQPMQPRAMASYMAAPPPESPCWRRISNYPNQLDGRFDDPRTPQSKPRAIFQRVFSQAYQASSNRCRVIAISNGPRTESNDTRSKPHVNPNGEFLHTLSAKQCGNRTAGACKSTMLQHVRVCIQAMWSTGAALATNIIIVDWCSPNCTF